MSKKSNSQRVRGCHAPACSPSYFPSSTPETDFAWVPQKGETNLLWESRKRATSKKLERERNELRQWKESAMQVLGEWEKTWEAAGSPGRLGQSKAVALREFILENAQDD